MLLRLKIDLTVASAEDETIELERNLGHMGPIPSRENYYNTNINN